MLAAAGPRFALHTFRRNGLNRPLLATNNPWKKLFQQQHIRQRYGRYRLQYNGNPERYAQVVTALNGKGFYGSGLAVKRLLFLGRGRSRFYRDPEYQFVPVSNTSHNAPGMIGKGLAIPVLYGIIVCGSKHFCRLETGPKFNSPNSRYRKYGMADQ